MSLTTFSSILQAPAVEVFALSEKCRNDPDPRKVNLTIGAYRDEEGLPWVLPVVRAVESQMADDTTLNHEYLPITGLPNYSMAAMKLLLGDGHPLIACNNVAGVQALGGTGALYIALVFLKTHLKKTTVLVSKPTWPNHIGIATLLGYPHIVEYRYWNANNRCVDFEAMMEDVQATQKGSVIVLHACAHNPTGMDLTKDQWVELANVIKANQLFPLFDIAYQGFTSGNIDEDAWSVRYFAQLNMEMFVAQSFSKNFGLYNERVGHLTIIGLSPDDVGRVKSQLAIIIRRTFSNPPNHGARVVAMILNTPALALEWRQNIVTMAERIKLMRQKLYQKLRSLGTSGTWNHIIEQVGMFSYSGLTQSQVLYLRDKHHIYLMNDGRINMCGLNSRNIEMVADAIHDAVTNESD